jgi:hypothetical protein
MPRLTTAVPKYRKHKQSGQAIVTLGGRDYLLGPHGTQVSRDEYDRLIKEWLAAGRSPSFGTPAESLSITELVVDYAEYMKSYHGTASNSEYHRLPRALRPVRRLYGKLPAAEFGVLEFKAVRQFLLDEGLSRSYINASMRRLIRMFKWAAAEGRLAANVHETLKLVTDFATERRPPEKPIP